MISSAVGMKAILLAGGKGTRLRPLTIHTPKPIVPIFDRPFLQFQLDLIRKVPEIDEVILSLNYQPRRIEEIFGDGGDSGLALRYMVEPAPLGTAGAIRFAAESLRDSVVVFNGDVLTEIDLQAVIALHRERRAKATIVLTPVENPSAYGLVEIDDRSNILRFLEKPDPHQITTDTINAGIYILETRTLELIPPAVKHSIERGFFPDLLGRGDLVLGPVHRGYWIDIGTPEKYLQVHRDILAGRFRLELEAEARAGGFVARGAKIADGAELVAPFFVGPGCDVEAGARVGPDAVLTRDVRVRAGARVRDSVVWPASELGAEATVEGSLIGPGVRVGAHAVLRGAQLGEGTSVSEYSRAEGAP
jgi:mannose-1-phosphate guanylyltransferase